MRGVTGQRGGGVRVRSIVVIGALGAALCLPVPGGAQPDKPGNKYWSKPAAGGSRSGDPEVIFTFDDGPDALATPIILDALAAASARAIFFWVGHRVKGGTPLAKSRRKLVRQAVAAGHLVGNHTVHHAHLCSGPPEVAAAEIDENARLFRKLTRMPVSLFRAPYGSKCKRLIDMLAERGLDHLHWDIDPHEFLGKGAEETAASIIAELRHLKGRAVILMHDTKVQTARAVPLVLEWIVAENERRRQRGERPIRILSGSDLLAEQLDPALTGWARGAAVALRDQLLGDVRRLIPVRAEVTASATRSAPPTDARRTIKPTARPPSPAGWPSLPIP